MMQWQWSSFDNLSTADLYAVLEKRQQVFILEQQCLYPDIDAIDRRAYHLLGWQERNGARELVAYLRCIEPGVKYREASLGRVLSAPSVRGAGIGKQLLEEGIRRIERQFPGHRIRISAQQYLERFYVGLGFRTMSEPYSEDGIAHVEMLR